MNRRKSIVLIAMVALLLTFTVSGTIAWLAASTDELVNTFTPGKIDTEIDEDIINNVKTKIVITNADKPTSTVPVYVRVSVSGYYVKDVTDSEGNVTGQVIVEPWTGTLPLNTTASNNVDGVADGAWFKVETEDHCYYYYSGSVAPGEATTNLLTSAGIDLSPRNDGSYLVINVVHQSIQYTPVSAVNAEWTDVTATLSDDGSSGTLTAKN